MNKHLKTLEFHKVLELLSNQAALADAAEKARELVPAATLEQQLHLLDETTDAHMLLSRAGAPSFGGIHSVNAQLTKAALGGVLSMGELLDVADVLRAVRYVRYHADKFNIDPDKIAVMGFSAGGHLANSALCAFDYGREDGDEIDRVSSRPDAVILCYAVISLGKYTHADTRYNLLDGVKNADELAVKLSGELQVKDDTPPCFIWHTAEDSVVPVQNSLQLYNALCEKKIYSELHVFPYGWHGLGLSESMPNPAQWTGLVGNWLDLMGFKNNA